MTKNVRVIKKLETEQNSIVVNKKQLVVSPYVRVSTDDEEQINSYDSQIKYYTKYIQDNPDWILGDIYADEGISGTQVNKREDFQRMIKDALDGKIDLIITKSISRFARNTVDTLKHVRLLKNNDIAVYFEKENINTLTMDGEVLLTILSSLAQQESESISKNVKMGVKMKMKRGEIGAGAECYGYDYSKETKKLTINKEEAEIVKYIFKRYSEGAGGRVISNELTERNIPTPSGAKAWNSTTILRMVQNEKYIGDVLLGKWYTVDPITQRTIRNFGEQEQYYVENHHEGIIDRDLFDKVQEIKNKRAKPQKYTGGEKRNKFSRQYAFSSITKCGFCGSRIERRVWHPDKPYRKNVWTCSNYSLNGKKSCPDTKATDERLLEKAFIQTFNMLQNNDLDVIKEFITNFSDAMSKNDNTKELARIEKKIADITKKIDTLVDMRLNDIITDTVYEYKYQNLKEELENYKKANIELKEIGKGEEVIKVRLSELKEVLKNRTEPLIEFDREVFDLIIDEVIIGGYDKNNDPNPLSIVFKLKSGLSYLNEIWFDKNKTGGRDAFPYSNIDTPLSIHLKTLYKFNIPYDFGNTGRFVAKGEIVDNIKNVVVKIAV